MARRAIVVVLAVSLMAAVGCREPGFGCREVVLEAFPAEYDPEDGTVRFRARVVDDDGRPVVGGPVSFVPRYGLREGSDRTEGSRLGGGESDENGWVEATVPLERILDHAWLSYLQAEYLASFMPLGRVDDIVYCRASDEAPMHPEVIEIQHATVDERVSAR